MTNVFHKHIIMSLGLRKAEEDDCNLLIVSKETQQKMIWIYFLLQKIVHIMHIK